MLNNSTTCLRLSPLSHGTETLNPRKNQIRRRLVGIIVKCSTLFILLFPFFKAIGQEDYKITINDTSLKFSLDKKYELMVNGKKLVFMVSSNDSLAYDDNLIGFLYPKGLNLSRTQLEGGVEQITIISAEGSGLIIQRYSAVSSVNLNELMLNEVTKESISYGFVLNREDYKKMLKSRQKIDVAKAVLKHKDETNIFEVTSIVKKDKEVLIMTMKMDDKKDSQGQKLIDMMWRTLVIKD